MEILPLQGIVPITTNHRINIGWGVIDNAFPNRQFPVASTHEFICNSHEQLAASTGFIAGIVQAMAGTHGVCACIGHSNSIFSHGLIPFGINPEQMVMIDVKNKKHILWAVEEALQCDGLIAVIGEVPHLDFTASRRLQLAVEKSKATGFLLRTDYRGNTTACVARWNITPMNSPAIDRLPGVGLSRWNVELLKIRNGRPGTWQLEWKDNQFNPVMAEDIIHPLSAVPLIASARQQTG